MNGEIITKDEHKVMCHLVETWNAFLELPEMHPSHRQEFMQAIHAAQRIVLARPALREINQRGLPIIEEKE
jgi:hypothetical protein